MKGFLKVIVAFILRVCHSVHLCVREILKPLMLFKADTVFNYRFSDLYHFVKKKKKWIVRKSNTNVSSHNLWKKARMWLD